MKFTKTLDNTVVVERDSEAAIQKTKKRKIPIVYNSDDSGKTKCGIKEEKRKKVAFVEIDSYVIPNCEPKYKDSESDIEFDVDII